MSPDWMWHLSAAVQGVPALLLAWAVVFAINAVTFPLPPAWTVLATFRASTHVALLPLTIGGTVAATLGRWLFAWEVRTFTGHLSAAERANAQALAAAAHSRVRWPPWLFVVVYSFLPVSSDAVFIAVGLGALPTRSSLLAFFVARSVYNTLMVAAAGPVVLNLADLFAGRLGWRSIVVVLLATGGYVLFLKLPWARWLRVQPTGEPATGPDTSPGKRSVHLPRRASATSNLDSGRDGARAIVVAGVDPSVGSERKPIAMTTTTSTDTNSFSARVRQHMTDVKASVDRTLADVQAAGSRAGAGLRAKRDEAQAALEARRREMEQANASMKAALEAKKAGADAAVADWKAKRDVRRLEDRADGAEEYATAAVAVALGAIEEAGAAILDAIVARADADEAKEAATAAKG